MRRELNAECRMQEIQECHAKLYMGSVRVRKAKDRLAVRWAASIVERYLGAKSI